MNDFHQMLAFEAEIPVNGEVHHLTVLCFHLQHPGLYSQEGLGEAKTLLLGFLERGLSPSRVREQNRGRLNSRTRTWKITARTESHAAYDHPVIWSMTAPDVAQGGCENYRANVRTWSQSILEGLRVSKNIS